MPKWIPSIPQSGKHLLFSLFIIGGIIVLSFLNIGIEFGRFLIYGLVQLIVIFFTILYTNSSHQINNTEAKDILTELDKKAREIETIADTTSDTVILREYDDFIKSLETLRVSAEKNIAREVDNSSDNKLKQRLEIRVEEFISKIDDLIEHYNKDREKINTRCHERFSKYFYISRPEKPQLPGFLCNYTNTKNDN